MLVTPGRLALAAVVGLVCCAVAVACIALGHANLRTTTQDDPLFSLKLLDPDSGRNIPACCMAVLQLFYLRNLVQRMANFVSWF